MRDDGPRALRTALQEGSKTPEEIAANLLRRLAPDHVWPPSDGSPLWTDYSKIVAAIGRTLDQPFKTRFLVVS